jgi:triosephosphate isomerase
VLRIFTGKGGALQERSAQMLLALGCKYVIIRHSERPFFESGKIVNLKQALKRELTRSSAWRDSQKEEENQKKKWEDQLKGTQRMAQRMSKIVLAYSQSGQSALVKQLLK